MTPVTLKKNVACPNYAGEAGQTLLLQDADATALANAGAATIITMAALDAMTAAQTAAVKDSGYTVPL